MNPTGQGPVLDTRGTTTRRFRVWTRTEESDTSVIRGTVVEVRLDVTQRQGSNLLILLSAGRRVVTFLKDYAGIYI